MAFSATATQGFEFYRYVAEHEIVWAPGDPGVSYARGDGVYRSITAGEGGLVIKLGDSSANPIGTVAKAVTCPASSTPFPKPSTFDRADSNASTAGSLIPIHSMVPGGTPVYRVAINGFKDDTVISYSATSLYIAATTGHTADDYPNQSLVYVYEGPGAGEMNVVDDYDHTGGAVELLLQLHRKFNATLTSSSKYIVLTGEASADRGISQFGRSDANDNNEIEMDDGANDGDFIVYGSWEEIGAMLAVGQLPVINKQALYST